VVRPRPREERRIGLSRKSRLRRASMSPTLLLAGAIVLLSGCVAQPQTALQPAPSLSPPRILHRLVLTSPQGQGVLELRREARWQDGMETMTDSASGAIVVTDDVGNWRFAYTKTSPEGVGIAPESALVGPHASSVRRTYTSAWT